MLRVPIGRVPDERVYLGLFEERQALRSRYRSLAARRDIGRKGGHDRRWRLYASIVKLIELGE
jgi:hypothetical protein